MMKKGIIFLGLLLFCVSSQAGMMVCNRFSCQDTYSYNPQEVLEKLSQMFASGPKELLFCTANEETKTCNGRPITFLGKTNFMAVEFQIPFARIYQVQLEKDAIQAVLNYQVQTNRYYPVCSPANTTLTFSVSHQGDFLLDSNDFNCHITELGETKMRMRFVLDYLNIDKGILGGTYQVSTQGDVLGGGSGYVLLKLSGERAIKMPRPMPSNRPTESGAYGEMDPLSMDQAPMGYSNTLGNPLESDDPLQASDYGTYGMGQSYGNTYGMGQSYGNTSMPTGAYGAASPMIGEGSFPGTPYEANSFLMGDEPFPEGDYRTGFSSDESESFPAEKRIPSGQGRGAGTPEPGQLVDWKTNKLVDWDYDNIKEKWNNFKTKFLKVLYLEPLDD